MDLKLQMTNNFLSLKDKKVALVGNGAVGKAIANHLNDYEIQFDQYDSKTIKQSHGTKPDVLIYAGIPGVKHFANEQSEDDMRIILNAFENMHLIKAKHTICISTIDAMFDRLSAGYSPYGRNRAFLEEMLLNSTLDVSIIRLPALKGSTIYKNIFYDLKHPDEIELNDEYDAKLHELLFYLEEEGIEVDKEYEKVLITNPYSRMYTLDLDNADWLNIALGLKNKELVLVADSIEPNYVYEIYENELQSPMPRLEFERYKGLLDSYDYSSLFHGAEYENIITI